MLAGKLHTVLHLYNLWSLMRTIVREFLGRNREYFIFVRE